MYQLQLQITKIKSCDCSETVEFILGFDMIYIRYVNKIKLLLLLIFIALHIAIVRHSGTLNIKI